VWIAGQTSVAFVVALACARASYRAALRCMRPDAWTFGVRPLARKLLTLSVVSCAAAVAGCAQHPAQRESKTDLAPAATPATEPAGLRIRRPSRALLAPQPAPDCELKASDLKTVDPDQWARLRLDYERQCYQQAEKMVRDRLKRLQVSSKCEIEPVRRPLTVIR